MTSRLCIAKLIWLCDAKQRHPRPDRAGKSPIPSPRNSPMRSPWIPRALRVAPRLDPAIRPGPPRAKSALLINPFYPKDPHASFGKHVLTPSLALTSIAGATPAGLGGRLLGREPAPGAAPVGPVPAGRRDHRPPDLRRPGVCPGAVVSGARCRRSSWAGCTSCRAPRRSPRTPTRSSSARGCSAGRRSSATSRRGRCGRSTGAATGAPTATTRRPGATCSPAGGS